MYDTDLDGGKMKRTTNTYWEVDLKAIRNIKTITFTGCKYVSEFTSTTPSTGSAATGSAATTAAAQDQITGMRLEVLGASNAATAVPIASRILGPNPTQTFTFNYIAKDDNTANKCFEPNCPMIEGIQSKYNGDNTCVYTTTGITNRAITKPIDIGVPYCIPYMGSYPAQTSDIIPKQVSIKNWVLDPSKPSQSLSCDILTGSILKPVTSNSGYDYYSEPITVSYTSDGSSIHKTVDTPYICIKEDKVTCPKNFIYKPEASLCMIDSSIGVRNC